VVRVLRGNVARSVTEVTPGSLRSPHLLHSPPPPFTSHFHHQHSSSISRCAILKGFSPVPARSTSSVVTASIVQTHRAHSHLLIDRLSNIQIQHLRWPAPRSLPANKALLLLAGCLSDLSSRRPRSSVHLENWPVQFRHRTPPTFLTRSTITVRTLQIDIWWETIRVVSRATFLPSFPCPERDWADTMDNSLDTIAITRLLLIFDSVFFVNNHFAWEVSGDLHAPARPAKKDSFKYLTPTWGTFESSSRSLCFPTSWAMCLFVALSAYGLFFYFSSLLASLTLLLLYSRLYFTSMSFGVVHGFLLVEGFVLVSPLLDPLTRGAEGMHICTISAFTLQFSVMPHPHMLIFPFICAFCPLFYYLASLWEQSLTLL
jgi:hypothetical protein